jgi:hypothetical protein
MDNLTTNLEAPADNRAEIYRADNVRIKRLVDDLMYEDDSKECEILAELICKVFSATYNDRLYGEGLYYNVMREIFAHHEAGRNVFDGWLQSNSWQGT